MGSGGAVGDAIINSPDIHAVSFTGSLPVGREVAKATAANLVKCQLEMGLKMRSLWRRMQTLMWP